MSQEGQDPAFADCEAAEDQLQSQSQRGDDAACENQENEDQDTLEEEQRTKLENGCADDDESVWEKTELRGLLNWKEVTCTLPPSTLVALVISHFGAQ